MSDFKFECPHCQQRLETKVTFSGRQIQCPACQHLIRVPPPPGAKPGEYKAESGMTWDTFLPGKPPKKD
jgi:hypothetical protein